MRQYADAQGASEEFRGMSEKRLYAAVTKRVKEMFPDKFPKKTEKPSVAPVDTPTPPKKTEKKSKHTFNDLTEDQKDLCKFFEKQGLKTRDEYIQELEQIGELK